MLQEKYYKKYCWLLWFLHFGYAFIEFGGEQKFMIVLQRDLKYLVKPRNGTIGLLHLYLLSHFVFIFILKFFKQFQIQEKDVVFFSWTRDLIWYFPRLDPARREAEKPEELLTHLQRFGGKRLHVEQTATSSLLVGVSLGTHEIRR